VKPIEEPGITLTLTIGYYGPPTANELARMLSGISAAYSEHCREERGAIGALLVEDMVIGSVRATLKSIVEIAGAALLFAENADILASFVHHLAEAVVMLKNNDTAIAIPRYIAGFLKQIASEADTSRISHATMAIHNSNVNIFHIEAADGELLRRIVALPDNPLPHPDTAAVPELPTAQDEPTRFPSDDELVDATLIWNRGWWYVRSHAIGHLFIPAEPENEKIEAAMRQLNRGRTFAVRGHFVSRGGIPGQYVVTAIAAPALDNGTDVFPKRKHRAMWNKAKQRVEFGPGYDFAVTVEALEIIGGPGAFSGPLSRGNNALAIFMANVDRIVDFLRGVENRSILYPSVLLEAEDVIGEIDENGNWTWRFRT
jgi:hypothetical protein